MENSEKSKYEVIITEPAENYFYEILDYLYEYYAIDRAETIADEIRNLAKKLKYQAERGVIEHKLSRLKETHRFILYKRSARAEIKIIYYIEEPTKTVYVTDFFPTEKDDNELLGRN